MVRAIIQCSDSSVNIFSCKKKHRSYRQSAKIGLLASFASSENYFRSCSKRECDLLQYTLITEKNHHYILSHILIFKNIQPNSLSIAA